MVVGTNKLTIEHDKTELQYTSKKTSHFVIVLQSFFFYV